MNQVTLSRAELEDIVRKAAAEGARDVLRSLGVPDDEKERAAWRSDLHEARGLIEAWRLMKKTAIATVTKWFVVLVLTALVAGAGWGFAKNIKLG